MFHIEDDPLNTSWMAAEGYAESKEVTLRKVVTHFILQNSKSDQAGPFIPYLAMNIFDRFISRHQLPTVLGRVRDDIVLAAESCLTLAWGMRDKSFSYDRFVEKRMGQLIVEPGGNNNRAKHFPRKFNILTMEKMIQEGLEWKLDVPTPVHFVDFFAQFIPKEKGITVRTINEIVIQVHGDVSFTRFLPSVIAASAVITPFEILYGLHDDQLKSILMPYYFLKESELDSCRKETREFCIDNQIMLGIEYDPAMNEDEDRKIPNIELKWKTGISEDPEEWTINSPDFRSRAHVPDVPEEGRIGERNLF